MVFKHILGFLGFQVVPEEESSKAIEPPKVFDPNDAHFISRGDSPPDKASSKDTVVAPVREAMPQALRMSLSRYFQSLPQWIDRAYYFEVRRTPDGKPPFNAIGVATVDMKLDETLFIEKIWPDMQALMEEVQELDGVYPKLFLLDVEKGLEETVLTFLHPFYVRGQEITGEDSAEDYIEAYNGAGEKLLFKRETWRTQILPDNLKAGWNEPQELYDAIVMALNDGFYTEVLQAARQLQRIDTNPVRGTTLLGIVLMKNKLLKEALGLYEGYLKQHGAEGYILTNLAKVHNELGDLETSEKILWQALEADPNQSNGLLWWLAIQRDRDGPEAEVKALEKVAAIPGSWYPQLHLGLNALDEKDLKIAMGYFNQILPQYADEYDILMEISGGMGRNGFLQEAIDLVAPYYDVEKHDPFTGLNLLQAYLELKDIEAGENLLHQLSLLNNYGITEHLVSFSSEFATLKKESLECGELPRSFEFVTVMVREPVWFMGLEEPSWLFPVKSKDPDAVQIVFVPLACPLPSENKPDRAKAVTQSDDSNNGVGRLSRAIPLLLSDGFYFETRLHSMVLVPVCRGQGPVVTGEPPSLEDVLAIRRSCGESVRYVVTGTIEETDSHYNLFLYLWDVDKEETVEIFSCLQPNKPLEEKVLILQQELLAYFEAERVTPPTFYEPESINAHVSEYLSAYQQSLLLFLVATGYTDSNQVWGERHILHGFLNVIFETEQKASLPKLMALAALGYNRCSGSDLYFEFKHQMLHFLEAESPKTNAFARLAPLVYRNFGMVEEFLKCRESLKQSEAPQDYLAWVDSLLESSPNEPIE